MRERDSFFGGVQPVLASKRPGKKKKEKKQERPATAASPGAKSARPHARKPTAEALETAPEQAAVAGQEMLPELAISESPPIMEKPPRESLAKAPAATHQNAAKTTPKVSDELARLRAELHEQREARAALETRLREAEVRLKQAESLAAAVPKRPAVAAPVAVSTAHTLDDFGIFAPPAATVAKGAPVVIEALETWLMEADLRANDAEGALAHAVAPVAALLIDALPESELSGKMASTRLALEAAEARAAHNARQVKKLTEELAEARAAQIRAEARIRAVEGRLHQAEARAGLLDKYVEEPEPEPVSLAWPIEALETATRPVEPQKPAATVTIEETPELLEEAEPPEEELELFYPEPGESADPEAVSVESSLALGPPLGVAPIGSEETAPAETDGEYDLGAALEAWGADETTNTVPEMPGAPDSVESPIEPAPAARTHETTEPENLEAALSDWGAVDDEEVSTGDRVLPVTVPDLPEEIASGAVLEKETPDDALSAWGTPEEAESEPLPTESEPELAAILPERASPASRESLLEALHMWSDKSVPRSAPAAEPVTEAASVPTQVAENEDVKKKSGKEAMVDALLRFMGPGS